MVQMSWNSTNTGCPTENRSVMRLGDASVRLSAVKSASSHGARPPPPRVCFLEDNTENMSVTHKSICTRVRMHRHLLPWFFVAGEEAHDSPSRCRIAPIGWAATDHVLDSRRHHLNSCPNTETPSMSNDFISCWVSSFEIFNLIPQSLQASGTPQEGTSRKNHQGYLVLLSLRSCLNFYI